MRRDDVLAILGTVTLFSMAWLDQGWRWFWAIAGVVMCLWAIGGAILRDRQCLKTRIRVAVVERSDPTDFAIPGARFARPRPPFRAPGHSSEWWMF